MEVVSTAQPEPSPYRRASLYGQPHKLIIEFAHDDRLRMDALKLADLLEKCAIVILRLNPRYTWLDADLQPRRFVDAELNPEPEVVEESRRRLLAQTTLRIASELRGIATIAGIHSEAADLTKIRTSKREYATVGL